MYTSLFLQAVIYILTMYINKYDNMLLVEVTYIHV